MTELPAVDVIIPAFNAERTLERAVSSVWATDYTNLKVFIVDDGSSDATRTVALELQDKYPHRLQVLAHPGNENRGVSASRNLGIEAGSAPWIMFLDADDEYLPNRFTEFARQVSARPKEFDALHEAMQVACEDQENDTPPFKEGQLFVLDSEDSGREVLELLLEGRSWGTAAIALRRSLLSRTGLFDNHRPIAEDCHLWLRVACVGRVTGSSSVDPVAVYRRHGTNAYRFGADSRLAMLDAMSDVARWSRSKSLPEHIHEKLASGVAKYAYRTCLWARENGYGSCSWAAIRRAVGVAPYSFLVRLSGWKQIVALMLKPSQSISHHSSASSG